MPQGYKVYEQRDSNRLIEEFMLLANISVATKIDECFPDLAVLRCHPEPKQQILDRSVEFLQRFGIDIDGSTSKTLQNSLNCYKPGMLFTLCNRRGKKVNTGGPPIVPMLK